MADDSTRSEADTAEAEVALPGDPRMVRVVYLGIVDLTSGKLVKSGGPFLTVLEAKMGACLSAATDAAGTGPFQVRTWFGEIPAGEFNLTAQ